MAERGEVIFLGGTAFSGADAVGRVLEAHRDVAPISIPAGLNGDVRGIPALLAGRIGQEDFLAGLSRQRAQRGAVRGGGDRDRRWDVAIEHFRAAYEADPLEACRALFWDLAEGPAEGDGALALLETSPGNLREAHTMGRLVPEAAFVHVVRDGRDVAVDRRDSSPRSPRVSTALVWWANELRDIERGIRGEEDGALYGIPEERFALVVVDELASSERVAQWAALMERLGLDDDPALRAIAGRELDQAAVGHERWRERVRGPARWRLGRRYRELLGELEREGNHAAPALIRAHERSP